MEIENCLKSIIEDLKALVENGIWDETFKKRLQIRIIASLGDNLEQNDLAGLTSNFSKTKNACRKCLCSSATLKNAITYREIHADNQIVRTDDSLNTDYQEKISQNVPNVHGVCKRSPFRDIPYFSVIQQLPFCYSHDVFEGAIKVWLQLLLEHLVKKKWLTWDALECLIRDFPYKGTDATSKPAPMKAKKMKIKNTRRIIGNFSQTSTLVRLLPQIIYDNIDDPNDEFWQWFLQIREFVRCLHMTELSESQRNHLNDTLTAVMQKRMNLTRVINHG